MVFALAKLVTENVDSQTSQGFELAGLKILVI